MYYIDRKNLVVVCKDEMLVNQLRKLVETKDDESEDSIVGTKDGTVKIVTWNEKVWLDQKKAGNIDDKILIVGDIKGSDKLVPVIDVKFDECGVKYGWAGDQAIITINPKALGKEEDYNKFLEKFNSLPVPEIIKKKKKSESKEIVQAGTIAAGVGVLLGFFAEIGVGIAASMFSNKKAVKQQMLFYGVINLYNNHLEEFMNS